MGDEVGIQGPYGAFILKTDADRIVFFAAGVGVTPFRSMIREALFTNLTAELVLFYSERTRAAIAYEQEFRDLAAAHPNFKPIFILTREVSDNWDGESKRMDGAMIQKYLPDLSRGRYCMCGPDEYMTAIKTFLTDASVDTKTKLQRESFG